MRGDYLPLAVTFSLNFYPMIVISGIGELCRYPARGKATES